MTEPVIVATHALKPPTSTPGVSDGYARGIKISPDNSKVVAGYASGSKVRIFSIDPDSSNFAKQIASHHEHSQMIRCCEWSPDSKLAISSAEDHLIIVFDVERQCKVARVTHHQSGVTGVKVIQNSVYEGIFSSSWDTFVHYTPFKFNNNNNKEASSSSSSSSLSYPAASTGPGCDINGIKPSGWLTAVDVAVYKNDHIIAVGGDQGGCWVYQASSHKCIAKVSNIGGSSCDQLYFCRGNSRFICTGTRSNQAAVIDLDKLDEKEEEETEKSNNTNNKKEKNLLVTGKTISLKTMGECVSWLGKSEVLVIVDRGLLKFYDVAAHVSNTSHSNNTNEDSSHGACWTVAKQFNMHSVSNSAISSKIFDVSPNGKFITVGVNAAAEGVQLFKNPFSEFFFDKRKNACLLRFKARENSKMGAAFGVWTIFVLSAKFC